MTTQLEQNGIENRDGIDADQDGIVGTDSQGRAVVSFERHFKHPVEKVWRAITDPNEVRGWLYDLAIDPRIGGAIALSLGGTDQDGNHNTIHGEITELIPQALIEYWIDNVSSGTRHILRWELASEPGGCALKFSNTFDNGERAPNSIICGWHNCLEILEESIGGRRANWQTHTRDRVIELYWHYRNMPRDEQG